MQRNFWKKVVVSEVVSIALFMAVPQPTLAQSARVKIEGAAFAGFALFQEIRSHTHRSRPTVSVRSTSLSADWVKNANQVHGCAANLKRIVVRVANIDWHSVVPEVALGLQRKGWCYDPEARPGDAYTLDINVQSVQGSGGFRGLSGYTQWGSVVRSRNGQKGRFRVSLVINAPDGTSTGAEASADVVVKVFSSSWFGGYIEGGNYQNSKYWYSNHLTTAAAEAALPYFFPAK